MGQLRPIGLTGLALLSEFFDPANDVATDCGLPGGMSASFKELGDMLFKAGLPPVTRNRVSVFI